MQIVPTNAVAGAQAGADAGAGEGAAVTAAMASVARRIMHGSYAIAAGRHHSHASPNRHDDRHLASAIALDRNPARKGEHVDEYERRIDEECDRFDT